MQTRTLQQNGVPPPIPPLPPELRRAELGTEYYQPTPGQHPPPPPPPPKPFDPRVQTNLQNSGPPPLPPLPIRSGPQYGSAGLGSQTGSTGALQPLARQPPQKGSTLQNNNSGSFQANQASYDLNQQSRREPISPISPVTTSDRQNSFPQGAIHHDQSRYSQQGQPPPSAGHPTVNSTIYQGGNRSSPYQVNRQQPAPQPYQLQQYSQKPLAQQPNPKPPQDLLSSPFEATLPAQPINAAPPPIPPNPQKDALLSALSQSLTQQINSTHASNLSALPPLRAQQSALTSTLNAVNTELSRLNDLENLLSSNEAILHQAMRDADKVLEDAKRRKVPNVDEVLVAPTVAAGQLYECVAEERAVEECRAVLVKALDKGRIGGGVWAKQTRSLAREEFLKKALVKKISKGMGLVEEERWG
ncbi:hypothetical protein MMC28_006713 [Mycoblastus sanguinarius]|nr:hypothetical protein [Mycoblastus sanguinarius]